MCRMLLSLIVSNTSDAWNWEHDNDHVYTSRSLHWMIEHKLFLKWMAILKTANGS